MRIFLLLLFATTTNAQVFSPYVKSVLQGACKGEKEKYHQLHSLVEENRINEAFGATALFTQPDWRVSFIKGRILQSRDLFKAALLAYQDAINSPLRNKILCYQAEILMGLNRFSEALNAYDELNKQDSNISYDIVIQNQAVCYLHLKQSAKAEEYFKQLENKHSDTAALAAFYMNKANLYYENYEDQKALANMQTGLFYARHAQDQEILTNGLQSMIAMEKDLKHYASALDYANQYIYLKDSVNSNEKVWELAQAQKKAEMVLKEQKILLLQKQNELKNAERKNILILTFFLLILTLLILWYAIREKLTSNIIRKQKEFGKYDLISAGKGSNG